MLRTITRHLKRFKHEKRGVSNVIVVMLSLVILVIISANVILWSYKMNQLDWEKMNEDITITNVTKVTNSSWFVAQSEYTVNKGSHVSGSYTDTQSIDGQYETFTEASAEGWLAGWNKRVKVTINRIDVDRTLTNFPVLIYLSNSSSGENDEDVSFIFDEIGSDRKRIAVTTSNGTTQCYVEIEKWDANNEEAWLWVKVPSMSNTTDTDLYLYYDAGHADNTAYVGDPQSTPAQNVWSPKYSAVFHFNNNFNDSVDGNTPSNTPGATFVAGKIAYAGEFYDNGDEADYTTADALGGTGAADDDVGTLAFWMRGNEASYDYMADVGYTSGFIPANYQGSTNPYLQTWWGAWRGGGTGVVTLNEWHHVVVRWNAGTGFNMWVDGASYNSYSGARSIVVDKVTIGNYKNHGAFEANAIIDEVRFVDDVQVSDAWVKASYETERDHLLDFGSEESLGVERNELDIVGVFALDLSTYPLTYIQTVDIQLKYNGSDTGENWYLKAYNWTATAYSDSGFNNTSGHTPTAGWDTYAVNLTDKWRSYVNDSGTMYVKLQDNQADVNQTTIDIDFLAVRVVIDGTKFTFKNEETLTSHLVSLWITNSTLHQRYDINVFINSADTTSYIRSDITLPNEPYTVKVVTERGNTAVFTSS